MRIIGGRWRGRQLTFPELDGLRPTGDRIRETLFNWLAGIVPDSRCLDLFAGSGALGFEALSRGAQHATLIEKNPKAAAQLISNATLLQAPQAEIVQTSALSFLGQTAKQTYDLIFIDPPFAESLWQPVIDALDSHQWLNDHAYIYIETPLDLAVSAPANWVEYRHKKSGQVSYRLYRKETKHSDSR